MTEFIDVAYVGLPLAGKSTSVMHFAAAASGSVVLSRARYLAREIVSVIPSSDADQPAVVVRTYSGAVWSAAVWEFQVAAADGVVVVLDPQPSIANDQLLLLRRLHRVIDRSSFEPARFPIAFQINKSDLVPKPDQASLLGDLWDGSGRTFQSCALKGVGVREPLESCLSQVKEARAVLARGLPRPAALALYEWSPLSS